MAVIERCPTEYYVAVDADHHRFQGGLVAVPVNPAAQAACHVPLAKVLDDCWNLTVNVR